MSHIQSGSATVLDALDADETQRLLNRDCTIAEHVERFDADPDDLDVFGDGEVEWEDVSVIALRRVSVAPVGDEHVSATEVRPVEHRDAKVGLADDHSALITSGGEMFMLNANHILSIVSGSDPEDEDS